MGPGMNVPSRITNHPADDFDPHFSHEGKQILFASTRSGNSDLWMMSEEEPEPVQLTSHAADGYDPDWSADENSVLFVSERDGNPEIYMQSMSASSGRDGGEITYFGEWFGAIQFSMPGNAFAVHTTTNPCVLRSISFYIADRVAEYDWKVLVFDGAPTDTVLAEGTAFPGGIGWHTIEIEDVTVPSDFLICLYFLSENLEPGVAVASAPQGVTNRWWTYTATTGKWNREYLRSFMFKAYVEAGPSGPVRLTDNDSIGLHPCWSPDNQRIAFTSNRGENMDIWLMNADGSEPYRLTEGTGNNSLPAWSSEGDSIAFVSDRDGNSDIYTIDVESRSISRITGNDAHDSDPAWRSGGTGILFSSSRNSGR